MYQRSKIQEESLYYETLKHTGEYPLVGVNTFLDPNGSPTIIPDEVIRATPEEKENQIGTVTSLRERFGGRAADELRKVQLAAIHNENVFERLMEACKVCSIGQITEALFEVGGEYRRSM